MRDYHDKTVYRTATIEPSGLIRGVLILCAVLYLLIDWSA